jgi:hypothetical protein
MSERGWEDAMDGPEEEEEEEEEEVKEEGDGSLSMHCLQNGHDLFVSSHLSKRERERERC